MNRHQPPYELPTIQVAAQKLFLQNPCDRHIPLKTQSSPATLVKTASTDTVSLSDRDQAVATETKKRKISEDDTDRVRGSPFMRGGNLTIATPSMEFCVYGSMLAAENVPLSALFRSDLGQTLHQDIVEVDDLDEDCATILSIISGLTRLPPDPRIPVQMALTLVQMGGKHRLDDFFTAGMNRLNLLLRNDLLVSGSNVDKILEDVQGYEVALLNVVKKEERLHFLLPGSYFICATLSSDELVPPSDDPLKSDQKLSNADTRRILSASGELRTMACNLTLSWWFNAKMMRDDGNTGRICGKPGCATALLNARTAAVHEVKTRHILVSRPTSLKQNDMCARCRKKERAAWDAFRKVAARKITSYFGLSEW